ncbi:F0F1 ATP synthase subunit B [Candidatus Gottesmanbacteria bacterium]|nr:F0F1 ATP synthase subunit B [Candidatus Gottesmanbacteria bacterium]
MEQLGIEPTLLLAQIINFSIIVFVLTRLLYKPILGILEKRKKEIEESLARAEKLKREEEKFKQKGEKLLDEARREGRKILEEAKKQGKLAEKEIIAEAHNEASDIVKKGKTEVVRMEEEMEKGVRQQAVTLAIAMAKRLLTAVLSEKDQHRVISEQLKELEKVVE